MSVSTIVCLFITLGGIAGGLFCVGQQLRIIHDNMLRIAKVLELSNESLQQINFNQQLFVKAVMESNK